MRADRRRLFVLDGAKALRQAVGRVFGSSNLGFKFGQFGVRFGRPGLARRTLPDFPVRALRVGRWFREAGGRRREAATIDLSAERRR